MQLPHNPVSFHTRLCKTFPRLATSQMASGHEARFEEMALELFHMQFELNPAYRHFCTARGIAPHWVKSWRDIPAIPTAAFKELEMSCLSPAARTHVFYSSGTTEQRPSRHFHNANSLALYEWSLLTWFRNAVGETPGRVLFLTPPAAIAPHSSLVHMFDTLNRDLKRETAHFAGKVSAAGTWRIDPDLCIEALRSACATGQPLFLLGTAFSFVHLLDSLTDNKTRFELPPQSKALETGGYKGQSRFVPRKELHEQITQILGIPGDEIVCEYGMCELSSQAYAVSIANDPSRVFHFPPWARAQIISPETGLEATEGETGLIRILDLANASSVLAVQTEDLGIRRGEAFELMGRAPQAEQRGCSLLAAAGFPDSR